MNAIAAAAVVAVLLLRRRPPRSRLTDGAGPSPAVAAAALGVPVVAAAGSWRLLAFCGVVTFAALWLRRRRASVAQRVGADRDATALTYALAAELRAGRSVGAALVAAAPHLSVLGGEVAAAGRAVCRGADTGRELERLSRGGSGHRLGPAVAALRVATGAGVAVADTLERLGAAFDADDRAAADLAAAAAGPTATAMVLLVLPLVGLAIGSAMGFAPLHLLLHSRRGAILLGSAAALDLVGWWWVRRLVTRAVRA